MRVLVFLFCAITASTRLGISQSQVVANAPPPLELDGTPQRPVLLSPREVIRAADDPLPGGLSPIQRAMHARGRIYDGGLNVELSVVLNQNGRVESAKPIRGPERFYEQAASLEEHRAFVPVRDKEGTIVSAHFTDYVDIDPPEQWLDHPPVFPEHVDLRTFRVTLERTGCFGSCPSYKVTMNGVGDVLWEGRTSVGVPGVRHAKISQEAVQALVDQVRGSHS